MVNDKKNIEEKDIILTQIIDEFFEKKRTGEEPTIEEYRKKYPEYAEKIEKGLEEELSWSARFHMLKQTPPIVTTKKDADKSWESFRTRMIWETTRADLLKTLAGNIEVHILRGVQEIEIVVSDILMPILTPKKITPALLGRKNSSRTINELEIPIPDIKANLKISIFPPDDKENIKVNVQPEIEESWPAKPIKALLKLTGFGSKSTKEAKLIPVEIKDRLKDVMVQRTAVQSGGIASFELSPEKDYSICIKVGKEKRTYEIPLKISESK